VVTTTTTHVKKENLQTSEQVEENIPSLSIVAKRNQGKLTPCSDASGDNDNKPLPNSSSGSDNDEEDNVPTTDSPTTTGEAVVDPRGHDVRELDEEVDYDDAVCQQECEKGSISANETKDDGVPSSDAHGNCDITTEDQICDDVGRDDGDNTPQRDNDRIDVNTATVIVDDDDSDDEYMVTNSHEVEESSQSDASDYGKTTCEKECDTDMSKDSKTVSSVPCYDYDIKTRLIDEAADRSDVCNDVDSTLQSRTKKMDVNIPSAVSGSDEVDRKNMVNSKHNEQQLSESGEEEEITKTKIHSRNKRQERDQVTNSVPKGQAQSYNNFAQVPNNSRRADVLAAIAAAQKEAELILKQNIHHADNNGMNDEKTSSRKKIKKSKSKRVKKEKDKKTKKKKPKKRESII